MQQLHIDRLLKLAEHLRTGRLEHKEFFFGNWNTDERHAQLQENGCGFAGCAIGECPKVFPDNWEWRDGFPAIVGGDSVNASFRKASGFFGVSEKWFRHLFTPGGQLWPFARLPREATRKEVADNIEVFVNNNMPTT
jgi:hypothetical protein